MPGVARIVCDGFVNGQPFDACPRQVLKRAVARLAERGWHLRTGIEPEFFLLKRDGDRWLPADDARPARQAVLRPEARWRASRVSCTSCSAALAKCGLDVLQIDHEDAHGQYELNFGFDEALASADHLMLFKLAAQALAEAHGMVFSMMPKPFARPAGQRHALPCVAVVGLEPEAARQRAQRVRAAPQRRQRRPRRARCRRSAGISSPA